MRRAAALLLAVAAALQAGCAGMAGAPIPRAAGTPAADAPPFAALAARFTDRALEQARAGDLHRARDYWRVVAALRPGAAEPRRQVEELTAHLEEQAARHYRDGLALLKEGKSAAARRALLLALIADPDHAPALEALKNRLEPDAISVTVAPGDSFESIARRHYGDAGKASLVARFNGLEPAGRLEPGTVLSLPVLSPPVSDAETRAAETAEAPYSTDPAAIGAQTPDPPPSAPAPVAPPPSAPVVPAAPQQTPPPAAVQEPSAETKERAEEHYNTGVRLFINENLEGAIQSWERALLLNPAHPNAAKDIEKARELQKKLREIR